jgi:hypothetical protein
MGPPGAPIEGRLLRLRRDRTECGFELRPKAVTTAMIATATPAAIKPYSIAVATDSSSTEALGPPACRICRQSS